MQFSRNQLFSSAADGSRQKAMELQENGSVGWLLLLSEFSKFGALTYSQL